MSYSHANAYVMDVLARYKNKEGNHLSMAGFQSNRLYKNIGDSRFVDVAYVEGVDSPYDGYVVAKADINGDGVQDLVLRNADPGIISIKNPPVQIFMGQKDKNPGIKLKLIGTASNKDAVGSEVAVKVEGMPLQFQQVIANNGCAQSEKALFFSLGSSQVAKEVRIKWPSGKVDILRNLEPGSHTIQETSKGMVAGIGPAGK
jgi:hypothetical protein